MRNYLENVQDPPDIQSFQFTQLQLEKSFKLPFHDIFQQFEREPIISSSFFQIHRAIYKHEYVTVKIYHADNLQNINLDLYFLTRCLHIIESLQIFSSVRLSQSLDDFKIHLIGQLNTTRESEAITTSHRHFHHSQKKLHQSKLLHASSNVIISTCLPGVSVAGWLADMENRTHDAAQEMLWNNSISNAIARKMLPTLV